MVVSRLQVIKKFIQDAIMYYYCLLVLIIIYVYDTDIDEDL